MEIRKLRATTLLNDYLDWPGVAQVCRVEREVGVKGEKPRYETAYAITSVPADIAGPSALLRLAARPLGNRKPVALCPRRLDGREREPNPLWSGATDHVTAAFRNAAIGFLRSRGVADIAAALRRNAAQVRPLLLSLGIVKQ